MNRYLPDIYKKDIFSIDYNKLKEMNIKCLIFDLDNTLALITDTKVSKKTKTLINKLKKDFKVIIVSNSPKKRVNLFKEDLNIDVYPLALKPLTKTLRKIKKEYDYKENELAMIGDQFITDMGYASSGKILKIFVDNLGEKDIKLTSINRFLEKKIMNKYQKQNLFEKGKYYE